MLKFRVDRRIIVIVIIVMITSIVVHIQKEYFQYVVTFWSFAFTFG